MRYYFDIYDGDHWTRDDVGMDCETDRRARYQAVLGLCEMAREQLPTNGPAMDLTIRVRRRDAVAFILRLDFSTEAGAGLQDMSIAKSSQSVS